MIRHDGKKWKEREKEPDEEVGSYLGAAWHSYGTGVDARKSAGWWQ